MNLQSQHPYRVVSPGAYASGYLELNGVVATRRKFGRIVRLLDDGNYLVKEPSYKKLADKGE